MLAAGSVLFQFSQIEIMQHLATMEHLAMMEAVLGPIPKAMAQASGQHNCFTDRDYRLKWPGEAFRRSIR